MLVIIKSYSITYNKFKAIYSTINTDNMLKYGGSLINKTPHTVGDRVKNIHSSFKHGTL